MHRVQVASSNIAEVGYESETMTLEVMFTNGGIYQYFDVPPNTYNEMLNSLSPGKYFQHNIRGTFRFARM